MPDESSTVSLSRANWGENPWFWLWLFAGAALLATVAIGPKYLRRQARLENKFEHRVDVWREAAATEEAQDGVEPVSPAESNQLAPGTIRSSLTPLVGALAAVFIGSGWMLFRSRWGQAPMGPRE